MDDKTKRQINYRQNAAKNENMEKKGELWLQQRWNKQHSGGPKLYIPAAHGAQQPDNEQHGKGRSGNSQPAEKVMIRYPRAQAENQQNKGQPIGNGAGCKVMQCRVHKQEGRPGRQNRR
nr:hypothetical protein [Acidocella sp.]